MKIQVFYCQADFILSKGAIFTQNFYFCGFTFFVNLMKHPGFTYTYFNMIDRRSRWLRNSQQDLETYGICYKKHNISWRKKTFLSIFVHVFISQKPSSSRENKNSHRFKSFPHWIKNRCWKRADNFTSQKCFSHQS